MGVRWGGLLLGLGLLSACTVVPTGPNVLVLPAVGKSMDVFQAEEGECRSYAQQQLGGTPEQTASTRQLQIRYDRAYVQCMYAKGNVVPRAGAPGTSVVPPSPGTPPPGVPQR
jgi:hypothetical protein